MIKRRMWTGCWPMVRAKVGALSSSNPLSSPFIRLPRPPMIPPSRVMGNNRGSGTKGKLFLHVDRCPSTSLRLFSIAQMAASTRLRILSFFNRFLRGPSRFLQRYSVPVQSFYCSYRKKSATECLFPICQTVQSETGAGFIFLFSAWASMPVSLSLMAIEPFTADF